MTEDERRTVYGALLTGLAETAQRRLCAQDTQHAWGPWVSYQVRHDDEDAPLQFDAGPIPDRIVHVASERKCLCCGKVQHD